MGVSIAEWDVLVLDLDGTLLCKQGEISDQNLHALDEVRDCGIEIVVATGRSYEECKHIVQSMNHVGVCITAGGSQLTDCNGGALARDVVDKSVVKEVTDAVLEDNHRCLLLKDATVCDTQYVLVGDAPLHAASKWWFESLGITATEVRTIQEDPWPEMTLRVGAIASGEALSPIAKSLEVILKDRAKLQHWSAVTCSEATGSSTHLLEVFGKTVNKWAMLRQHLGSSLDRTRIAAIGDGLNDIEVLKEAGLSIVMENADEHVRRHADVITGHHDGSGFVDAMRRWIIPRLEVL
jgi:hypothetical protein